MQTVGAEITRLSGLSEDDVFGMVRGQIEMIMTEPFRSLNLMALVPQAATMPTGDGAGPPTSLRGWVRLIRSERKRMRSPSAAAPACAGPRRDAPGEAAHLLRALREALPR